MYPMKSAGGARHAARIVLIVAAAVLLGGCQEVLNPGPDIGQGPRATPGVVTPQGDGKANCGKVSIAYVGPIKSGSELGASVHNGAELAVRQHNDANPGCQVHLVEAETEGVAKKAKGIAAGLVGREDVIGVVGLPLVDESQRTGAIFDKAGLVQVSPSVSATSLADEGWRTFYRATANDTAQGNAAAQFLSSSLGADKVCIVREDSAYGEELADVVSRSLEDKVACERKVRPKQTSLDAVAAKIKKEKPDGVFFAGRAKGAGALAKALDKAKVRAQFVAADAAKDKDFVDAAGEKAAEGAYFTCPCSPTEEYTPFAEGYEDVFGESPGSYAVEGYDVATMLLSGIDAGKQDRTALRAYVDGYDGKGLSNEMGFNGKGELVTASVWAYRVTDGQIERHGRIR